MRTLLLPLLLLVAAVTNAQCSPDSTLLTPTLRALLTLERPATVSVEQWEKMIENPANRLDLPITIYEEDTMDTRELPKAQWYILLPGRRPPEKQPTWGLHSER